MVQKSNCLISNINNNLTTFGTVLAAMFAGGYGTGGGAVVAERSAEAIKGCSRQGAVFTAMSGVSYRTGGCTIVAGNGAGAARSCSRGGVVLTTGSTVAHGTGGGGSSVEDGG